jgi:hypothetical protein
VFPIQNDLKQGNASSPLLLNFALEYTIGKVQENKVGLKLSEAYQLIVDADNVNLLQNNINTIRKTQKLQLKPVRKLV